eukprot:s780_g12.t3
MGAASAPDPAQPGDGKTAANVTEGQARPSEPNSQDAAGSAGATGTTNAEARAPPQQPQQEQPQAAQPQSAQPQGPPPNAEPQPPPRAAPAGSAQGPAAEPMPACHYEVLGLELNCTEDEIKKAYRELSKKYHPDKNFGCTDAKERFQRINEAKIVLLDRKQRVTYDAKTYTEKLLKSIGADFNQQVQQWVELTMLTQADFKVDHVPIARQMTDILPNHFNLFMQQCGARFMSMHSPTQGVVLIGGNPAMIKRGKELIHNCMDELEGKRAPADGLIFIVPPQHQGKMPMMVANFAGWSWTYGTQIHQAPSDRLKVVIRGGSRWPAVVATLQQFVDFTGTILNTSGQTLDCWRFAHMCELCNIAGAIGHLLPPQWNPDKNTLRELFKYALQLDNAQQSKMSLFDLALRAVKQRPSCATVRAASSAAVYAEYNQLPTKQSAQLLLAFSQVQSSMSQAANFIQQRFVDQHLQTLQRLGPFLDCGDAMLLRSKGFIAAKEAVPDDSQWHRWDDVLRPDGRLAAFWKDLRKFFQQNERLAKPWGLGVPPAEWHTVPDVMCNVLKRCVQGTNLSVDLEKGIFRTKEPPPPAAPPPAPKTVAPPLPTGPSASAASGEATARAPVEEHLTLVEHAEDLMFELSSERKHDPAAYLDLEMVTQKLQKRLGQDASKISKDWYMKFEVSFAVQKVNSSVHSFVKLASPGRKRADVRDTERRRKAEQKEVFEVVKRVLPTMLKNEAPPTSMQEKESCALLALLSRETTERCKQDLPKNTLQKLCGGNVRTDELLRSTVPFSMAMVMQAVTALQKRSHHFEEKALVEILRAAALEMHDKDGPSGRLWAPLTVVRDAVLAACKEPFLGLFKRKKDTEAKLLPTSCALRICSELVMSGTEHLTNLCPPCLSESYGSFRVFAELCGALATLYGCALERPGRGAGAPSPLSWNSGVLGRKDGGGQKGASQEGGHLGRLGQPGHQWPQGEDLSWIDAGHHGGDILSFARSVMSRNSVVEYECYDGRGRRQGKACVRLIDWEDHAKEILRGAHLCASDGYYQWYASQELGEGQGLYHICTSKRKECAVRLGRGDRRELVHLEKWRMTNPLVMAEHDYSRAVALDAVSELEKGLSGQLDEGPNAPEKPAGKPQPKSGVGALLERKAAERRAALEEKERARKGRTSKKDRSRSRGRRRRRDDSSSSHGRRGRGRSQSSDSSPGFQGPSTRGETEMWRRSQQNPGVLLKKGMQEMGRYLADRAPGEAGEEDWAAHRMMAYISQVILTQHPPASIGVRNHRELLTLGRGIDMLVQGQLPELGDLLMQRLKALETALVDQSWNSARHQEIIPPHAASLTTVAERRQTAKLELASNKLKEMTLKNKRASSDTDPTEGGGSGERRTEQRKRKRQAEDDAVQEKLERKERRKERKRKRKAGGGGEEGGKKPYTPEIISDAESFETVKLADEAQSTLEVMRAWLQSEDTGNLSVSQTAALLALTIRRSGTPLGEYLDRCVVPGSVVGTGDGRQRSVLPLLLWKDSKTELEKLFSEGEFRWLAGSWGSKKQNKGKAAQMARRAGMLIWHGLVVTGINFLWTGGGGRGKVCHEEPSAAQTMALNRLWEQVKDFVDDSSESTEKIPRSPSMGDWGQKLGDVRISYHGEIVEKAHHLTPPPGYGGSVPLIELVEGELRERLMDPPGNLLAVEDMPEDVPQPNVHASQGQCELIAKELFSRGLVEPVEEPLMVKGKPVCNGAFGVVKPGRFLEDERPILRLIMDFRATNSVTRVLEGDIRTLTGAPACGATKQQCAEDVRRRSGGRLLSVFSTGRLVKDDVLWRLALRSPLAGGAGLLGSCEIRRDSEFPDLELESSLWSLYLDDTSLVEILEKKVAEDLGNRPSADQERLRKAYQDWAIPVSKEKSLVRAPKAEKLGAVLDGERGVLKGSTRRALENTGLGFWLLRQDKIPRKALQVYLGKEAHTIQFRRPLFGVFDYLWKDVAQGSPMVELGPKSVEEVLLSGMLQPMRLNAVRWPGCELLGDINKVTKKEIEKIIRSVPGLTGVVAGGGSPCQGLSKLSAQRQHLEDPRSKLFYRLCEILGWIGEICEEMGVWVIQLVENVVGDDEDVKEMSEELGGRPLLACSSGLSRVRWPRLYWSNIELEDHESFTRGYHSLWDEVVFEEEVGPMEMIPEKGWCWPAGLGDEKAKLPTFTRAIPRTRPPVQPAGIGSCSPETLTLWKADKMKYPPYTYQPQFLFQCEKDEKKQRVAVANERERLMGYRTGYTLGLFKKEPTNAAEEEKQEVERCAAIGNSFHAVTVACLLDLWLWTARVRSDPLGAKAIVKSWHQEMGEKAYGDFGGLLLKEDTQKELSLQELEQEEAVMNSQVDPKRAEWLRLCGHAQAGKLEAEPLSVRLIHQYLRRTESRGSDIRLDLGIIYKPDCVRRTGVDPRRWLWRTAQSYRWTKREHINLLELRAVLRCLEWRSRSSSFHTCRFMHLSDSQIVLAVLTKGRSSSRRVNRLLRKVARLMSRLIQWKESKAERRLERAKLGRLSDQRISHSTRARYEQSLKEVAEFVNLSPQELLRQTQLEDILSSYIERLWEDGESKTLGSYALAAVQFFHPQAKGRLGQPWKLMALWNRLEQPRRATPLDPSLLLAFAGVLCRWRWKELACLIIVGFCGLLRTGEMFALQRSNVLLSKRKHQPSILFLYNTKTTKRNLLEAEKVLIYEESAQDCLRYLCKGKSPEDNLVEVSPPKFRSFWKEVTEVVQHLGLEQLNYLPYSLRRGGATSAYREGAVSIHLGPSGSPKEPEALMRLEEAFDKLANLCQKFCNCISSRDPRGLARLAYAFAKVGGDSPWAAKDGGW